MMQEPIGIPACFSSGERPTTGDHPPPAATITKSGQSIFVSVYRTKVAGQCRMITITWCKNVLLHGLSITIEGPEEGANHSFKIELKPWYFWRKQGSSNRFQIDGKAVNISWDLRTAKFNGETEPQSDYYVAVVCEEEAVLLLGDRDKDACRKTGSRHSLIEPILVSKKEHIFGKKKFSARGKFHEKGRVHEISIECSNNNSSSTGSSSSSSSSSSCSGGSSSSSTRRKSSSNSSFGGFDPEMEIRIDGHLAIHVKHLQWKFRGNECISVNKIRVEVYWDVHDWLFSPGLRHALFIFKPISIPSTQTSSSLTSTPLSVQTTPASIISTKDQIPSSSSEYCLFLYAWRVQ